MKKILILIVITIFASNLSYAQKHKESALEKYARIKFRVETSGDVVRGVNENYSQVNVAEILKETKNYAQEKDRVNNISFASTMGVTIYDFVSNGTPQLLLQDQNNVNKIHFVCMFSPWGDPHPDFPNRRVTYWYSTNSGSFFTFVGNVTEERGGFPNISLMPNGIELISLNMGSAGNENAHFILDAAAGLGIWVNLYNPNSQHLLYPRTVFTSSLTNPTKFISVVSSNDIDSAFWLGCTSLSPTPGTFTPLNFMNAKPAECYFIAKGSDGRIGIVYIANDLLLPADIGDVYFMESTNNGTSFGNPTKISDANISPTGDSLGAFRGISMVYQGNVPKVVFETVKQTTNGYYYPGAPAKIRFWSTSLTGSDPNRSIVVADTSRVGYHPYISKGIYNDAFASLCRPTIGRSLTDNFLYVSFMVPSDCAGGKTDSCSFMNMWFTRSINSGSDWSSFYTRKINKSFPRLDYTYPCISPSNDVASGIYYVNMAFLLDTIPGSYINHPANGQSLARFMFIRERYENFYITDPPISLVSPVNASTNILLNPALVWTSTAGGSVHFRAQISTDYSFKNIKFDTVVTNTQVTVPSGKLNISTLYYWRVCVGDTLGYSDWTRSWSFTTRSTGINTISSEIPKEYKLFQNYPNPFNPNTIIRFQIKDTRFVTLKIYDILSKEVATLVNEKLNPGYYETQFSINSRTNTLLSSGIYFYKLEAGNFSDIKRMVLIK
jgi:hypothetical protein